MAHKIKEDDDNIIKKCNNYGFCCTYDMKNNFNYKSVTEAIAAVLKSRETQSEKLNKSIIRTNKIKESLQELIESTEELTKILGNNIALEANHQNMISSYRNRLAEENSCLNENLSKLEEVKRVMDRKNIRVPVVGVINSGKSTFLHSALGGSLNDKVKENLFPSAGAHKSCTGTRTVLIYDNNLEDVKVVAKFKDKPTFWKDCKQSICRMIKVLENLKVANQFPEIYDLQENFISGFDPIALLNGYYQSAEFNTLCKTHYQDERVAESVHDFCSLVHFSKNQDYSEDEMDLGTPKNEFSISNLIKSWNEGESYSMQIPSDNEFELVKKFVCKYDPNMKQGVNRYTTYCGVQVVEIRGNLCEEVAGLELVDSVGTNDDAISNEDQMRTLMQDSDAMILLERPQPQGHGGWSIKDCIDFVKKQKKIPSQFLYLVYNCYNNNMTIPSDLSLDLDSANKFFYSDECKRIYVSDVGEWEEVQSKMLVDMLVNLSNSVEETHKENLNSAEKAKSNISRSIHAIVKIAEDLEQICNTEKENASEKKKNIEHIFQQLFGEVEQLAFATENENETTLRVRANDITKHLIENLNLDFQPTNFNVIYEYVSPASPRYVYNRYVAFLCMYSHMLEDVKHQYNILKNDINLYVENKRRELLKILWESGHFKCIMSDLNSKDSSVLPSADEICEWLKQDAREILADALKDLLLHDIGTESLIDESIGKVIEQFDPKNLTAEKLFGQQMSDPNLENNEKDKVVVIKKQLSKKANELKIALLESVTENVENSSDTEGIEKENTRNKKEDDIWGNIFKDNSSQDNVKASDSKSSQDISYSNENLFDLDQKVRKGVVCDGILKKFRDKLRGDGLPQNAEQPINQLYNLYDHYYDVLLSKEEISHKKHLSELRSNTYKLAKGLIALCQN